VEQRALVEQVKANRARLPELMTKKEQRRHGWAHHDSRPAHEAQPSELQAAGGNDRETQLKRIIWDELGTEGGVDGINTYDSETFTWGKGFSSGDLRVVMHSMFAEDPEAEQLLLNAGIALHGDTWMVVDNNTGGIETGANALKLLQYDNKLLSVFITLGNDPKHAVHAANAQWKYMKEKTGNVPKYAYQWPENSIRLLAHFSHWMEHLGWGYVSYEGTGGDQYRIIQQFAWLIARRNADAIQKLPTGAIVLRKYNLADWDGHRLFAFARGSGIGSLKAGAKLVHLTAEQLKSDETWKGHLLLPSTEANGYYDLGTG
jgi:hypothetical protein